MTKSKLATFCLACALPLVAWADNAQGPRRGGGGGGDTRPAGATAGGGGGDRTRGPGGFGPGGNGGGGGADWGEWRTAFETFCKKHSPNRAEEIYGRNGSKPSYRAMGNMIEKFRTLKSLEEKDPALYEVKVRQIEVEDAEYGFLKQLRDAEKAKQGDKQTELKGKLHAEAERYVDLRLKERALRIEKLKKLIAAEETSLASDTDSKDRLADERVSKIVSADGLEFFNPKPGRRPGFQGPGARGGGGGDDEPNRGTPNVAPANAAPIP